MDKRNNKRNFSRLIAVQVLYQYDFYKSEKDLSSLKADTIDCFKVEYAEKYDKLADVEFVDVLVDGVIKNLEKIDAKIKEFSIKEQKSQDDFLKQIIRLAVFELEILKDAPVKVVINEYVNISSEFCDEKIVNFVNGILDNIGKNLN
jgi:N utilization substance protein B